MNNVTIRRATSDDAEACGTILFDAYVTLANQHGFPPDFHTREQAVDTSRILLSHPSIYSIVAQESSGKILGSNYLDERDTIRSVGPLTVDPQSQGSGVGRLLMNDIMARGEGNDIRLLTNGYNTTSIPLYASLGFQLCEPLFLLEGRPHSFSSRNAGGIVRPMTVEDLHCCASLCRSVHGFDRTHGLRDILRWELRTPFVYEREGRITAYISSAYNWTWNHGVAETAEDMQALLLGAAQASESPLSLIVPPRQSAFFRWCLEEGLRIVKPLTLMATSYQEPRGCWFPSIEY